MIIGGKNWRIIEVLPTSHRLRRLDGTYTLGVTDMSTHCVYISAGLDEYTLLKVISHELVHVYAFNLGLIIPEDIEELMADFIATYGRDIISEADAIFYQWEKKAGLNAPLF